MLQEWKIRPRSRICSQCERPFEDGEMCITVLQQVVGELQRRDLCKQCGEQTARPDSLLSIWQSAFKAPEIVRQEEPVRRETAESLLRRLAETNDPEMLGVIYVLAVMLERNRTLIERDVRPLEGDSLLRVYEHRRTGETFIVTDPRLHLDELDGIQQQVVDLLSGGQDSSNVADGR